MNLAAKQLSPIDAGPVQVPDAAAATDTSGVGSRRLDAANQDEAQACSPPRSGPAGTTPAASSHQVTEMLLLPDGRVLVHNLTPVMAAILGRLNPADEEIRDRVSPPKAGPASPG